MKRIKDLDEIKSIELDILKYIHNICEENHLIYFMAGGTLLGAVRHKGFIPWDDDIDLLMFREDYEKMIRIINEDNSIYHMESLESDKGYISTFAKVTDTRTKIIFAHKMNAETTGVFVDIFPMDGVGNNYKKGAGYVNFLSRCYHTFTSYRMSMKNTKFSRFFLNKYARLLEFTAKRKACKSYRYIARVVNMRGECEIMKRKWFEKRIMLDFEGEKFYAPKGYDHYLRRLYGNYMQLPPSTQQRLVHSYSAYWK